MKKLYGAPVTPKWRLWIVLPLIVLLIAVIVFTGFAVKQKDFSKGMNIGIDFSGGSVVTIVLGEKQLGKSEDFNKHLKNIEEVIKDKEIADKVVAQAKEKGVNVNADAIEGSISYSQKSDTGENMSIIVKYDNVSKTFDKDNSLTNARNKLIEEKLKSIYSEEAGYDGVSVNISYIGATASAKLIKTALIKIGRASCRERV